MDILKPPPPPPRWLVSRSLLWKGPLLAKEGNFVSFGKATLRFNLFFKVIKHSLKDPYLNLR